MKFGQTLQQVLVPEWRERYLDYETGKRHVQCISRAAQRSQEGSQHGMSGLAHEFFSRPQHILHPPEHTSRHVKSLDIEGDLSFPGTISFEEQDFFDFLDNEVEKVEAFYKSKEEQALHRMESLREQLQIMRKHRSQEARAKGKSPPKSTSRVIISNPLPLMADKTEADHRRDYIKKEPAIDENHEISYRVAKHKLKLALQEFYRSLELLKAFANLNRTAFRKLNKKYDKAIAPNGRPTYKYMHEKVDKTTFASSKTIDEYLEASEDMYTQYFENGNHKVAVSKLRALTRSPGDTSRSTFACGTMIGVGLTFAVEGVVNAGRLLFDENQTVREQTSFLLQIYGGYFFMLYLFWLYCFCCWYWTKNKINYALIFEFDVRHNLDWRQLAEFPSFFTLLFGIVIWAEFSDVWYEGFHLYYPVILMGVTALILFLPLPTLRYRSRRWFIVTHWRLITCGLFAVEFRDVFLGDLYVSLTYAVANAELFFCLYAVAWNDPSKCDSKHSRLFGALLALVPAFRALQCIRRYIDSRHAFPHLVNCLKYIVAILTAVALNFYRLEETPFRLSLFISLATLNAVYGAVWDIFMDFSFMQVGSHHLGLRDNLAFNRLWLYYAVLILDPLLRFGWIATAIFSHNAQHGSVVAFIVAFCEVTRRGMWALIRVENEHCSNVNQQKASRDIPLPYVVATVEKPARVASNDWEECSMGVNGVAQPYATIEEPLIETGGLTSGHVPHQQYGTGGTLKRISMMLANAHREDSQRKRDSDISDISDISEEWPEILHDGPSDDGFDEVDFEKSSRV